MDLCNGQAVIQRINSWTEDHAATGAAMEQKVLRWCSKAQDGLKKCCKQLAQNIQRLGW